MPPFPRSLGLAFALSHDLIEVSGIPPLAQALASKADSPQAAREIYIVSAAMIDDQNPMERAWLDQLAPALSLEPA